MYIRDANGYVDVNFTEACSHTMEQQAVWPHVNQESAVRTAIAGKTTDGRSPAVNVTIKVAPQKETPEAAWTTWSANFVMPADLNVRNYDIKLKDFLQASQPDGQPLQWLTPVSWFIMVQVMVLLRQKPECLTLVQYKSLRVYFLTHQVA